MSTITYLELGSAHSQPVFGIIHKDMKWENTASYLRYPTIGFLSTKVFWDCFNTILRFVFLLRTQHVQCNAISEPGSIWENLDTVPASKEAVIPSPLPCSVLLQSQSVLHEKFLCKAYQQILFSVGFFLKLSATQTKQTSLKCKDK